MTKKNPRKKPIKVLQVAPMRQGGISSIITNISKYLNSDEITFDYLAFRDIKDDSVYKFNGLYGKVYTVKIDKNINIIFRTIHKFVESYKVFKDCDAEIIHINSVVSYEIFLGVLAKMAGINKVFFHSHTSDNMKYSSQKKVIHNLSKWFIPFIADECLACSDVAAKYMFSKKTYNIHIINNGICTSEFKYTDDNRIKYRNDMNINNRFVIGHVGRFIGVKNHSFIIDVFEEILKKIPNAYLVLVGNGRLFDEIYDYIIYKKLNNNILLFGSTDNVAKILSSFDIFFMPSLYEGLPVSGIEAQASGLPCVFSDTITKEIAITDLCKFISLSSSKNEWADLLIEHYEKHKYDNRVQYSEIVSDYGFDIEDVAKNLSELYLK